MQTVKVEFHQRFEMWGYTHATLDCVTVWDAGGHRERLWEGQKVVASDGEVACLGTIFWVNIPGDAPRCFVALQGDFFDVCPVLFGRDTISSIECCVRETVP